MQKPRSTFRVLGLIAVTLATPIPAEFAAAAAAPGPWTLHEATGAPENLQLSGSVRARLETLAGQPRAGLDTTVALTSLRSTLFAEYRKGWFRLGGELYDSRAYPREPGSGVSTSEVNAFEPVQAYVLADLGEPFGGKSAATLQLGRFVLNLGSRRLVAADDYRNATSGYTGARADLKSTRGDVVTLIYTQPQVRLPDDLPSILDNDVKLDRESDDLVLWGGVVTLPRLAGATFEASWFDFSEQDRPDLPTRNRNLQSASARVYRDPAAGQFDFEVEGITQSGSVRTSTAILAPVLDVSAAFYHVEAGYQWATGWKPRVSVEYDYATGDDADSDYGRFDTLFGMRRADFSPSGILAAIGRSNLRSPGIRLEGTPSSRADVMLAARGLWLEAATDSFSTTGVRDVSGRSGDFAGYQLDGRWRYWVIPRVLRFEADAAVLLKGRFFDRAPNSPTSEDTRFLSVNITSFF